MTQANQVLVTVTKANGAVVEGALVAIESGSAAYPETAYVTDTVGRAMLTLPIGVFRICATDPDSGRTACHSVTVTTTATAPTALGIVLP